MKLIIMRFWRCSFFPVIVLSGIEWCGGSQAICDVFPISTSPALCYFELNRRSRNRRVVFSSTCDTDKFSSRSQGEMFCASHMFRYCTRRSPTQYGNWTWTGVALFRFLRKKISCICSEEILASRYIHLFDIRWFSAFCCIKFVQGEK